MNTETPTPAPTKKPRALPRVWRRYASLTYGEGFFIGRTRYIATGYFHATTVVGPSKVVRVWPWTRVQTDTLVRDVRAGGKSSVVHEMEAAEKRVDGVCICGAQDVPPNNDNNITGPTS